MPWVMVKARVTSDAAENMLFPACDATMVHVPVESILTAAVVAPFTKLAPVVTEQTFAGVAVKEITIPLASVVALIANGSASYCLEFVRGANVML